jgi:hypothetical protein
LLTEPRYFRIVASCKAFPVDDRLFGRLTKGDVDTESNRSSGNDRDGAELKWTLCSKDLPNYPPILANDKDCYSADKLTGRTGPIAVFG